MKFSVKHTDGDRHGVSAANEAEARAKAAERNSAPVSKIKEVPAEKKVGR